MSIPSLLVFIPSILMGTLLVHLLWSDRKSPLDLILQLSLGTGLGLGISSMLYYLCLFFHAASYVLYIELALSVAALIAVYWKWKKTTPEPSPRQRLSLPSSAIVMLVSAGLIFAVSFAGIVDYSRHRAHGDWDAWMIYNRSARFIYRGGEAWRDAFSSGMDITFHADYPPLLALNIASRWQMLNSEITYVPMFLGFLFTLSTLGLCFGALAKLKSPGQGALGLILLSGVSFFLGEGGRQTADMPLALYLHSSIVFIFFYHREKRPVFMGLAALMTGLAAWTKNEGVLFLLASAGVLFIVALWKRSFGGFLAYFAGMLLPLILIMHFKTQVAPSSEFAEGGLGVILQKLGDFSRHQLILDSFGRFLLRGGGWYGIGIFPILMAYTLLFRRRDGQINLAIPISLAILACQFIGYYLFYLISPYDLNWHIIFSINRLFVHAYPAVVFLVLSATPTPETVFSSSLN